ncbi:MAG: hypothetical protein HYZ53_00315 [Planctomycetes bacterium]|nr:hypothetical protein [Planctomycetota bacterium]
MRLHPRRALTLTCTLFPCALLFAATARAQDASTEDDAPLITRLAPVETYLFLPQAFVAGSPAAIRVSVREPVSLLEARPAEGAEVRIALEGLSGAPLVLFEGRTDATGCVSARVTLPDVPEGRATLRIQAVTSRGRRDLQREIQVRADRKSILLTTDKPLYQPGQVIRLRALAVQESTLVPAARAALTFVIDDAKGNKVFKRGVPTSEYGVASADFTLADEVLLGDYTVSAQVGAAQSKKTVVVKRYVLPKFRPVVTTDRTSYLPRETVRGEVQADYLFGKPVAGAEVHVRASTFDAEFHEFAEVSVKTDERGHASFEVTLPESFVGQPLDKGNALLKLDVSVRDTAGHAEEVARTLPVTSAPVLVAAIPESGRLVPGVENRIYLVATYPDGTPAAGAEVDLDILPPIQREGGLYVGPDETPDPASRGEPVESIDTLQSVTGPTGIATILYEPQPDHLEAGGYDTAPRAFATEYSSAGEERYVEHPRVRCRLRVRDAHGSHHMVVTRLETEGYGRQVLVRLDKAIYAPGEAMVVEVLSPTHGGTVFLDILRNKQTVLATMAQVESGRARYEFVPGPDLFGSLEVHAYQVLPGGDIVRDGKVAYVQPAEALRIKVETDRPEYKPGESGVLRFQVTDASGRPAQAALGLVIVDEAVYALQDMQPGLERVYFTLQKELAEPKYAIKYAPASVPELTCAQHLDADRQEIACVLLASADPCPRYDWTVNPATMRAEVATEQCQTIAEGLEAFIEAGKSFSRYDAGNGRWDFRKDLLDVLVEEGRVPAAALRDPWKGRIGLSELAQVLAGFEFDRVAPAALQVRKQLLWDTIVRYRCEAGVLSAGPAGGPYAWRKGLLEEVMRESGLPASAALDPWGVPLTLEKLAREEKAFQPTNVARAILANRLERVLPALEAYVERRGLLELAEADSETGEWHYQGGALERVAETEGLGEDALCDACGRPLSLAELAAAPAFARLTPAAVGRVAFERRTERLKGVIANFLSRRRRAVLDLRMQARCLPMDLAEQLTGPDGAVAPAEWNDPWGQALRVVELRGRRDAAPAGWWSFHALVSDGPDQRPGTPDDLAMPEPANGSVAVVTTDAALIPESELERVEGAALRLGELTLDFGGGRGGGSVGASFGASFSTAMFAGDDGGGGGGGGGPGVSDAIRVREKFPETLVWRPELVTDEKGAAELPLEMADSITTWRLSASGSSKGGLLGSATAGIRCFQDFFVDLDLPVSLTQHDEVAVPVAVYNYLKEPQTVRLEVQLDPASPGFELLEEAVKSVALQPGQVTSVSYRVRVKEIGRQTLTVVARGTRMNDAVRRSVDVVPDGKLFEQTVNERLGARAVHTFVIPERAIDRSLGLVAKVYPGAFSQVVEGIEGLLGMPHG